MSQTPKIDAAFRKVQNDFFIACLTGDEDAVKSTLTLYPDAVAWQNQADHKKTGLHHAAEGTHLTIAQLLVAAHADVDAKAVDDLTPLMCLCTDENEHRNDYHIAELLIEHHADMDAQDNKGRTALHHAAQCGQLNVAHTLMINEANLDLTTRGQHTALRLAEIEGYAEVADRLREEPERRQRVDELKQKYIEHCITRDAAQMHTGVNSAIPVTKRLRLNTPKSTA